MLITGDDNFLPASHRERHPPSAAKMLHGPAASATAFETAKDPCVITLLLSLIWPFLAAEEAGIPYAWVAAVVLPLSGSVAVVFKLLIDAQKARFDDQNAFWSARFKQIDEARDEMRSEAKEQWGIVERSTRAKMLVIAALTQMSPQVREDTKALIQEIEAAQARRKG